MNCPACGAPAERGQLMCLDCGGRLALEYRRPTGWGLPAAIVAVIVLAAGGIFALVVGGVEDEAERELASQPAPVREPTAAERREERREERRRQRRQRLEQGSVPAWPAGREGFTVVILNAGDEAGARDFAERAREQGVGAGVLDSNLFSSLGSDLWLVWSGRYASQDRASRAAERLADRFPGAYPQEVTDEGG